MDKKNKKEYCLSELQMVFNKMLTNFLEMGPDKYYFKSIENGLNKYSSLRNIHLKEKNPSEIIISIYNDLKKFKKEIIVETKKVPVKINNKFIYPEFKKLGWQYNVINFIQKKVDKKINNFIKIFLIHGSFATKDFVSNWSDLDTKIILNDNVFENSSNLEYVQKWMRKLSLLCDKIDPLSHHRLSFLTEFDLEYYPSFIFPPILYKYSLLLNGKSDLEIHLRNNKIEKNNLIKKLIEQFEKNTNIKSLKEWKNNLSCIMLWPTLMLQAKGLEIYKKDSFIKVKKEFPEINFDVIDQATEKMKKWKRINLLKYYPNFLFTLMPFRFNQIVVNRYRRYFNKNIKDNDVRDIRIKALKLFKESINE